LAAGIAKTITGWTLPDTLKLDPWRDLIRGSGDQ